METHEDLPTTLYERFYHYCKVVLRNEARSIQKHDKIQAAHETYLSELDERGVERLGAAAYDEYATDYTHFSVSGYNVAIHDEALAEALLSLPDLNREIVLLKHYVDMTDKEVGEVLKLARSTVQRKRLKTLELLKTLLEDA